MIMLEIRPIKEGELKKVLEIRKTVFIEGQNVPEEIEYDGLEDVSEHIIVILDNKPIGCARIRYIGKTAKLERIAILEEYRGKGYGKELVIFMAEHAAKKADQLIMHAQYYLLEFYKSIGFEPYGEKFLEAGIEHIKMKKII